MRAAEDRRPVILLTGFGPFPGVTANASTDLVEALAVTAAKRFPRKRVIAHTLPTEWTRAPQQLETLYATHTPVLALHFGVSQRATGFCIETQACNTQDLRPDAQDVYPSCAFVSAEGPATRDVLIPAAEIVARLNQIGVRAELSHHAGTYLCNSVLYRSIEWASKAERPVCAGFIHMPAKYADPAFGFATALRGGIEIIRTCLDLPEVGRPERGGARVNRR